MKNKGVKLATMWGTFINNCLDFCITTKKLVQSHYVLVYCRTFNLNLATQQLRFKILDGEQG